MSSTVCDNIHSREDTIRISNIFIVILVGILSFLGAFLGSSQGPRKKDEDGQKNENSESKPEPDEIINQVLTPNRPEIVAQEEEVEHVIPSGFVCCITSELFVDPVVTCDGHSYEYTAIKKWFERHDTSPKTGEKLLSKTLFPNHNLRSQLIDYRLSRGLPEIPPWQPHPIDTVPTTTTQSIPTSNQNNLNQPQRIQTLNVNIPREELAAIFNDISTVFGVVPELIEQLNLRHLSSQQREQTVIRTPGMLQRLALVSRERGLEQEAVRFSRLFDNLNRLFQETAARSQQPIQHIGGIPTPTPPPAGTPATPSQGSTSTAPPVIRPPTAPDEPPMFRAARAGDASGLLRELVTAQTAFPQLFNNGPGQPIDRPRNTVGESLLMVATVAGQPDMIRALCNASFTNNPMLPTQGGPADPSIPSPMNKATPLHCAAMLNQVECLRTLFEIIQANAQGDDTMVETIVHAGMAHGDTPLHRAALGGAVEAVTFLIDTAHARVDKLRNDGNTALHLAAARGHVCCVEALLARHALVSVADFARHLTPVHVAARGGHDEVLRVLLNIPANDSLDSNQRDSIVSPNIPAKQNIHPLHLAAVGGHYQTCSLLVNNGAEIGVRTTEDQTALSLACHHLKGKVVEVLLSLGADPKNMGGVSEDGRGPFHRVLFSKNSEISMNLINAGIDITPTTKNKSSALHLACWSGLLEVATAILDRNADMLNWVTEDGDTALHQSAFNGHVEVCELLLERGASVNAVKLDGSTALHLCAKRGMAGVARLLLAHGANPSILNALSMDALTLAKTNNQHNVATAIEEILASSNNSVDTN